MRVSFSETDIPLPVYADIISAAKRLKGKARRTPLLESKLLNDQLGGRLLIKPECLQLGGAFKFRGAYNAIEQLVQHGASGVAAYSSGNHAQGVALA
ncbi:MAG: pyridoxal-phosphate dependent enzyme, partial [Rhodospirillaceae bacterium]|nr:pyridoxal-phosphate dependent enzyme [Rhodospirillaceae bacterium]